MLDDLQPDKARNQCGKTQKYEYADEYQAHAEIMQFAFRIFKFCHSEKSEAGGADRADEAD
ncbi:hypothetical protein UNDYM_5234 [Undibacterium sp. YM2]|nr:hypothetical protein UNDYM_5234 [Undibacterium sp. YM2]